MRFENPFCDASPKRPVGRLSAMVTKHPMVTKHHRIVGAVSPAASYIFAILALGAARLYPELCWPLLAYLAPSFWAQPECYRRNTNRPTLKSFSNALGSVS